MSIQAVILETGDTIICDMQEVLDKEKNESLGYKIQDPFVIDLDYSKDDIPQQVEGADIADSKVNFTPWCPLAAERDFRVERDFCRVIYNVHGDLVEMYINMLSHWNEHNINKQTIDTARTIVTTAQQDSPFSGQGDQGDAGLEIKGSQETDRTDVSGLGV